MFKCRECGCEFEEKPDYCDCGNDTFEEIVESKQFEQSDSQSEALKPSEISNPKTEESKNYHSEVERNNPPYDPIAIIIFLLCIISSMIVLFFVGNPKEPTIQKSAVEQKEVPQATIPSIDSFWNNSTTGIINNEKTTRQRTVNEPPSKNPIIAIIEPKLNQPSKSVSQPAIQEKKQSKPSKVQTELKHPTNNNPSVNNKSIQSQPKPKVTTQTPTVSKVPPATRAISTQQKSSAGTNTNSPSKISTPVTKPAQTTPKTPAQTVKPPESTLRPKATIDTAALKKELDNYKIGLRNTIGRKVDFTRIIGDGECVVSFKVSQSGKLTNRSFSKQSQNITLNDAVYKAVMATPAYNPPPGAYNNEMLNLKVRFYNGNYDISLY